MIRGMVIVRRAMVTGLLSALLAPTAVPRAHETAQKSGLRRACRQRPFEGLPLRRASLPFVHRRGRPDCLAKGHR
jgi:hypothetical protein